MRIALYGNDKDELEREWEKSFNYDTDNYKHRIEIFSHQDEQKLMENLAGFQIVLMETEGIRGFKRFLSEEQEEKKITFSAGKSLYTFCLDDIYYIEAELSKIHLVTGSEEYVLPITISEAEDLLGTYGFLKIHRGYLINASHIQNIKQRTALLDNGKELPVSKYRLKCVKAKYLDLVNRN